jgi:nucleoside 2-deoxyribosyltransferase
VAMWFHDDMSAAWRDGLQKGISAAGYKPLRIDNKEHANKVCDEIISEIRRSRFLVADYTGHRGGVYYEAGYAAGRGLPVILTCRKDAMTDLHFDIRQYNCIDWQSPAELARRLEVRIEAILGDGPFKRN